VIPAIVGRLVKQNISAKSGAATKFIKKKFFEREK